MNAETMIKEYDNYKRQAELLKNQIINFKGMTDAEMIETMNFSKPCEERIQKSGISDKTSKIALNYENHVSEANKDLYDFILKKYRYCIEEISFFETSVSLLPPYLSDFISDIVFNKLTWDELAQNHNISRQTVARYKKKAIAELDKLYAYRDSVEMEYMLS